MSPAQVTKNGHTNGSEYPYPLERRAQRNESATRLRKIPSFINIIEGGKTPSMSYDDLAAMGYCSVAYPLTLLAAGIKAMREALQGLLRKTESPDTIMRFEDVCSAVGFQEYWDLAEKLKKVQ